MKRGLDNDPEKGMPVWPKPEPNHESYGVIGITHMSSSRGIHLFDATVPPLRIVKLSISQAAVSFAGTGRHIHDTKLVAEIWLSPTQFAEMLTTPNQGVGTPCTIKYMRDGERLTKCADPPPQESDAERIRRAFREEVGEQLAGLKAVNRRVDKLLDEAKVSAKTRESIRDEIHGLIRVFTDSAPFVMERFEEHTDATIQQAKAEVVAYVDGVARDTGLAALKAGLDVPSIELLADRASEKETK